MQIMRGIGPKTDPCGTLECITGEIVVINPTRTWKVLRVKNDSTDFSVTSYSIFFQFLDERLVWKLVESI